MAATQTFALAALSQFVSLYEEALVEKAEYLKGTAPSGPELQGWMMTMLLGESAGKKTEAPPKTVSKTPELAEEYPEPPKLVRCNAMELPKMSWKELKNKFTYEVTEKDDEGNDVQVKKSLDLPFLPESINYSETCQAVKVNGGLFTPCMTRPAKDSEFCKCCENQGFLYGKLSDRMAVPVGLYSCVLPSKVEGKSDVTKSEISFGTYIQKRGLERVFVEKLLQDTFGSSIEIPEHMWTVDKSKSRRVVKPKAEKKKKATPSTSSDEVSSVESDGETAPVVAKKPRGRPKKVKTPEEQAAAEESPKKKRGRPMKAKKVLEVVEEESVEQAAEAESVEPVAEEESVEPVAEAESVEPVAEEESVEPVAEAESDELQAEEPDQDDEDEDDETEATFFNWKGKQYAYTDDNTLYEIDEDGESTPCGTWDPETQKPVFAKK